MTYTLTETLSASGHATVPPTCLQTAGITLTCDQVDQLLQALIAANSIPVKSAHCAGSGSCECDVTLAPTTTNEMGTYATSGTTLTTTSSTSAVNSIGYCVQKNELHMPAIDVTMPTDAMGNPNISSDTVFRKN
jgi:Na+-transporting NADH:ubiquinone oxidoreductase subunit NqrF